MPSGERPDRVALFAPDQLIEADHELRTLVTVARTHLKDWRQRDIVVRLDDGPKVKLRYGQSFTIETGPGAHRFFAHNTFMWKTIGFTVESGEHLEFVVVSQCGPIWMSIAAILGAAPLFLKVYTRSVV